MLLVIIVNFFIIFLHYSNEINSIIIDLGNNIFDLFSNIVQDIIDSDKKNLIIVSTKLEMNQFTYLIDPVNKYILIKHIDLQSYNNIIPDIIFNVILYLVFYKLLVFI